MTVRLRIFAFTTSLAIHAGAGFAFLALLTPDPVPVAAPPEREFRVESLGVAQSRARPGDADAERPQSGAPEGPRLAGLALPLARAEPARLDGGHARPVAPDAVALPGARVTAPEPRIRPVSRVGTAVSRPARFPRAQRVPARETGAGTVTAAALPRPPIGAAAQPAQRLEGADPGAGRVLEPRRPSSAALKTVMQAAASVAPVAGRAAPVAAVAAVADGSERAAALSPAVSKGVRAPLPSADPIRPGPAPGVPVAGIAPDEMPVPPNAATGPSAPAARPGSDLVAALAPRRPDGEARPPVEATGDRPAAADALALAGRRAKAIGAALSPGSGGAVDPLSIAAVQAFVAAGASPDAARSRDAIRDRLAREPCARLQAEFLPETGELELRGHVPDEARRAPVLASLESLVGESIPLRDNLKILPPPQCGVLARLDALGLPQAREQRTDPRLVGRDAHVRSYSYRSGQRLILDVAAPEYSAYIYVDFFDAEGQVLHIVPNARVPELRLDPGGAEQIGGGRARYLDLVVGPPYGRELAVAFAASHRIADTPRPLREPAGPYLDWLAGRIADARARWPDFRGEWVYFHVETAE